MGIQQLIRTIFPTQCASCGEFVEDDNALCGRCWSSLAIINGLGCGLCGLPLHGDDPQENAICDDCSASPRPWSNGRALFLYEGLGRRLVLKLKHSDRPDLAEVLAEPLAAKAREMARKDTLVTHVPAHWQRRLARRYDQAELLAEAVARRCGLAFQSRIARRLRKTVAQEHMTVVQRVENVHRAFDVPHWHVGLLSGRHILLVDDVLTSGATMAAVTDALLGAGARQVDILALARVAKEI